MMKIITSLIVSMGILASTQIAFALETLTAALTSKAFQYVPLVIAQERGYMKEEGLELKLAFMQNAPGLEAVSETIDGAR